MLMQPRPRAETSRLLFPSVRFCIVFPFSYPRVASLIVVARASELTIANVLTPIGARAALVDLPHRDVRHEAVRRCAVPVPFAGRRVNHIAWTDLDDFTATGLHQAAALRHVQRLAARMSVPGGASTRREPAASNALASVRPASSSVSAGARRAAELQRC